MTKEELEKGIQKIHKWTGFINQECENSFNYIMPVFLTLQDLFFLWWQYI